MRRFYCDRCGAEVQERELNHRRVHITDYTPKSLLVGSVLRELVRVELCRHCVATFDTDMPKIVTTAVDTLMEVQSDNS